MAESSLRILQANVAGAETLARSVQDRATALATIVRENDVDVVIVQAALDASGGSAPLDALCELHPDFDVIAHLGMAILSRVPIEGGDARALTGLGLPDDRNARHLLVAHLPDHGITLGNAHFSWVAEQAERNIVEAIAALAGRGDALLVGDFNQPPDAAPIRSLAAAGFVDAWARLRPDALGESYAIGNLTTRIDYVFERAASALVTRIERLAAEPDSAISNHAVLLAEIAR